MLLLACAQAAFAVPQTVITASPPSNTSFTSATFEFDSDSSDDPANIFFDCKLDTGSFEPCGSPHTYLDLAEGPHTFSVQATDSTGTGEAATYSWIIDTTSPGTTITAGPPALAGSSATFEFTSDDLAATFKCSLDSAEFQTCTSPQSYTDLAGGSHTFSVQAIDQAGNVDGSPATWTWEVDATAPQVTITGPSSPINSTSVTFEFAADDPAATFECSLDSAVFDPCTPPTSYTDLAEGNHTYRVRATNALGNSTVSTFPFTVSLAPPSPPAPAAPVSDQSSAIAARPAASFVLIAGRAIKVNRNRAVAVRLNCSGNKDCAGRVVLTTTSGLRFHRRRLVLRLGSARFAIPATATAKVKVRLSKRKYRLLKRMRRARVLVTVTDIDGAGRARISTREINLRA